MIEVLKEWGASILPWVLLDEDTPKKAKLAAIELLDVVDNRELYGYLDVVVEKVLFVVIPQNRYHAKTLFNGASSLSELLSILSPSGMRDGIVALL